jgi:putative modified peptide
MAGEPLPQNVVETLLEKLATDDTFRALFQKDPEAALKQAGSTNPKQDCACLNASNLPSKQIIQQTRTALLSQLTTKLSHAVFAA